MSQEDDDTLTKDRQLYGDVITGSNPPAPSSAANDDPEYKAFTAPGRAQKRLRIIDKDGKKNIIAYRNIENFVFSSGDRIITILLANLFITVEGDNLEALADQLQDEKVRVITCFNDDRHVKPLAPLPIIKDITEYDPKEFTYDAS